MKIIILTFILLFFNTHSFSGTDFDYQSWYQERYNFFKKYKTRLKSLRQENQNYNGVIVETIKGEVYTLFDIKPQAEIDKAGLEHCKKQGGIKCKVRIQSFKINPDYNRLAVYNDKEKKLDVGTFEFHVERVLNYKNIIFLNNSKNFNIQNPKFSCTSVRGKNKQVTDFFLKEIDVYPEDFIKKTGLKFVVFCGNISANSSNPIGLAPSHYDKSPGVFYVNLKRIREMISLKRAKVIRHTFHHELYHVIDAKLTLIDLDNEWSRINQYPYSQTLIVSNLKLLNDGKGFITNYAKNNVSEDKAEVFANLINDYKATKEIIKGDRIIFKKTQLMISRLKKISPSINKKFWDSLN